MATRSATTRQAPGNAGHAAVSTRDRGGGKRTARASDIGSFRGGTPASPLLWRLVVWQGLRDAFLGRPGERREALRWLDTDDFVEVCEEANIAPGKVIKLAQELWKMQREQQEDVLRQLKEHLGA